MKKFAKLIALVLALVLVLSLAACKKSGDAADKADASSDAPATVVGKWKGEISAEDTMKIAAESGEDVDEANMEQVKQLLGDSTIVMTLELTEDGKITFAPDQDSLKSIADTMMANVGDLLPTIFNVTPEELDEMLQQQGMTKDQLIDQIKAQLNPEEMFKNLEDATTTGIYEVEGDKIYTGETGKQIDKSSYIVFELKDGKLTLKEIVGDLGEEVNAMKALFPWEFTRIG